MKKIFLDSAPVLKIMFCSSLAIGLFISFIFCFVQISSAQTSLKNNDSLMTGAITPSTKNIKTVSPINTADEFVPIYESETVNTSVRTQTNEINQAVKVQNMPASPSVSATTSVIENKIQNTANTFETMQATIQNTKVELIKIVDQNIREVDSEKSTTSPSAIKSIREGIISNINSALTSNEPITQERINELSKNIKNDLNKINDITQDKASIAPSNYSQTIEETFKIMSLSIEEQVKILKTQGGDMIYKDSNNDGISDYDSVNVYNIDPVKPAPTAIYNGKEINAGEKVLLGYDPREINLIKITPEEPEISLVKPTAYYKVDEVKLTSDKKITITGRFLPNSFVTIYIYSTPIIITVKTDANGEWHYTLDKELDDGRHTIYTATVNNTGKILAKSSAFTFVKTAEAVSLENIPPVQESSSDIKPAIWSGNNIYIFFGLFVMIIIFVLIIIGIGNRKNTQPLQ